MRPFREHSLLVLRIRPDVIVEVTLPFNHVVHLLVQTLHQLVQAAEDLSFSVLKITSWFRHLEVVNGREVIKVVGDGLVHASIAATYSL